MDGQIIVSGVSIDDFKSLLATIVEERVSAALNKKHSEEDSEKLLSPKEAVKLFNPQISVKTLANWTKLKLIPSKKVGRKVLYRKVDVLNACNQVKKYKRN